MYEYRKEAAPDDEELPPQSPARPARGHAQSYRSLAAEYGAKPRKRTGKKPSGNRQSVEEEYQAYVTANLSPEEVDNLKFWEVGCNTVLEHY